MLEWPQHTENQTNIIQSNVSMTNHPQTIGKEKKAEYFSKMLILIHFASFSGFSRKVFFNQSKGWENTKKHTCKF